MRGCFVIMHVITHVLYKYFLKTEEYEGDKSAYKQGRLIFILIFIMNFLVSSFMGRMGCKKDRVEIVPWVLALFLLISAKITVFSDR